MNTQTQERPKSVEITAPSNPIAQILCGPGHENLKIMETELGVTIHDRGNLFTLTGQPGVLAKAKPLFEKMMEAAKKGPLEPGQIRALARHNDVNLQSAATALATYLVTVNPRTMLQGEFVKSIIGNDIAFGIGPAGTGKTYLAMAFACAALKKGAVERIVLVRPAVEAGEKLGFLPGDLKEKVDPYMRPFYDALGDFVGATETEKMLTSGVLEIAPLAFMRGRTLTNSIVLFDEAQNSTPTQMEMLLTRLGEGSKIIVTGDIHQNDLPKGQITGLQDAFNTLQGVEGIGFTEFTEADVVRHDLVRRVVSAYERAKQRNALTHG